MVDTSVWSLAYRRDTSPDHAAVSALRDLLARGAVVTTGLVYLELLRGFTAVAARATVEADFAALPFLTPSRRDYEEAADHSLTCRRAGVQLSTVDAMIAAICISRDVALLTTDQDFVHAAAHVPLRLWAAP
ncbi:MAG: PIN domain-containing protein [Deltaproteobacteria bacterium]|nr:PIN domain-containing protein [Deltaproteobacteria bacterium]